MDDHLIQMRWADIDQLNHVNNVRYVDYADEARRGLIAAGELDAGLVVACCEVEFLKPLHLSRQPVTVTSECADGRRLTQEIRAERDGEQVVFARVTTDLVDERAPIDARGVGTEAYPFQLRRRDAGDGIVSNANHFELFQEARILVMSKIIRARSAGGFVVARVTADFARDLPWRAEAYPVHTWVEKIGRSSIQIVSEIAAHGCVYARATAILVAFDPETQRSRPFDDDERGRLEEVAIGHVAS